MRRFSLLASNTVGLNAAVKQWHLKPSLIPSLADRLYKNVHRSQQDLFVDGAAPGVSVLN